MVFNQASERWRKEEDGRTVLIDQTGKQQPFEPCGRAIFADVDRLEIFASANLDTQYDDNNLATGSKSFRTIIISGPTTLSDNNSLGILRDDGIISRGPRMIHFAVEEGLNTQGLIALYKNYDAKDKPTGDFDAFIRFILPRDEFECIWDTVKRSKTPNIRASLMSVLSLDLNGNAMYADRLSYHTFFFEEGKQHPVTKFSVTAYDSSRQQTETKSNELISPPQATEDASERLTMIESQVAKLVEGAGRYATPLKIIILVLVLDVGARLLR